MEDHASGPEFLLQVEWPRPAAGLTDKLLTLVTTVIDARNVGIQKGDLSCGPVDIVLGSAVPDKQHREEIFVTVETQSNIDTNEVREHLEALVDRWISEPCPTGVETCFLQRCGDDVMMRAENRRKQI